MPIIKKTDIIEQGKVFDSIQKEIDNLTISVKKLIDATRAVNKEGNGAEAKQRIKLTQELTVTTDKLVNAEGKRAQEIARNNQLLKDSRDLTKAETVLLDKSAGTLEKLAASNRKLSIERKKLNLETEKGRQKLLQINSAIDKNNAKIKQNSDALTQQRIGIGKYTNALKGLGRQLLGALGITAGITTLVSVVKNAAKIFVDFQASTSKLAAILNKTKTEISDLTKQAKDLGASTAYTATQVIELQTELAKLGFSTVEIKNSTEGILNLAAATGSDLASAAELAGSTLRIFNLDASEMGRVSDVLAKSTTISSLSMEKLAAIMPTVGKTAQIAGVSLERTAALAGTLTDRGLDASTAGTALRNIFLQLAKSGISWNDAMKELNQSTDKNKTAIKLFGIRSAAAGVILSETAGTVDKLTEAMLNAQGEALKMSKVMLDNVAGDVKIAQSAWEGFVLSIESGEGPISKAIRSIIQGFTDYIGTFTKLNDETLTFSERTEEAVKVSNKFNIIVSQLKFVWDGVVKTFTQARDTLFDLLGIEKEEIGIGENAIGKKKGLTKARTKEVIVIEEETSAIKGLTTAQKEQLQVEKELNAEKSRRAAAKADNEVLTSTETIQGSVTGGDNDPIGPLKDMILAEEEAKADARERELELTEEHLKALNELKIAAITATGDLLTDIVTAGIDEELNKKKDAIQAERDILKQKLDDGLINEKAYKAEIEKLNKKERREEAKANKKKALYEIAIATAIAIARAIPNPVAMALAAALGLIQAGIVAAKPLPAYAKGTDYVEGKGTGTSDSVVARLSKGERVVPAAINAKLAGIRNEDLPRLLSNNDNGIVASLLTENNKINGKMLTAIINSGVAQFTINGITYTRFADGSKTFKEIN